MMKFKKKLISAIMSLAVATVLMASSSYAWFTISTNPEVSNIKTSITANENIEIALDNGYANAEAVDAAGAVINGLGQSGNPYTWGNLLDLSTAMTNIGGTLSLKPVGYNFDSATGKVTMKTPEYGLDGRVARLNTMAEQYISAFDAITAPAGGVSVFKPSEDAATADALAMSFWLRSNEDVKLRLSEGTYRADDGENADGTVNAANGGGSTLTVKLPEEMIPADADDADRIIYPLACAAANLIGGFLTNEDAMGYLSDWNDAMEAYRERFPLLAGMVTFSFHICMMDSATNLSHFFDCSFSPEEIDRYKASCGVDIDSMVEHGVGGSGLLELYEHMHRVTCMGWVDSFRYGLDGAKLLRFLNKLRIRILVGDGDEMEEYFAVISDHVGEYQAGLANKLSCACDERHTTSGVSLVYPTVMIEKNGYIDEIDAKTLTFGLELSGDGGLPDHTALDSNWAEYFAINEMMSWDLDAAQYGDGLTMHAAISDYIGMFLYKVGDIDRMREELNGYLENQKQNIAKEYEKLPHIGLTANEAKKVRVYMYLDGEAITNADAALIDGIELSLNLQFEKIGGATNAMTAAASDGN